MKYILIFSICILAVLSGIVFYKEAHNKPPVSGKNTAVSEAPASDTGAGRENALPGSSEDPGRTAGDIHSNTDSTPNEDTDNETVDEEREPLQEYESILKVNPYVAGWLRIEGSGIDSPVVYTPKSQNYFLHRDLDGSEKETGTLFIAALWLDGYNNTLIYGHNMKDGKGFGSLGKYADHSYAEKHPVIRFDTLYEEREYEVLGAFFTDIEEEEVESDEDRSQRDQEVKDEGIAKKQEEEKEKEEAAGPSEEAPAEEPETEIPEPSETELTLSDLDLAPDFGNIDVYRLEKDEDEASGAFRYYYFTDLTEQKDYEYYVNHVKEESLYDTGVDANWGDELLTLSTCSYHAPNGRFIVVAKRIR